MLIARGAEPEGDGLTAQLTPSCSCRHEPEMNEQQTFVLQVYAINFVLNTYIH